MHSCIASQNSDVNFMHPKKMQGPYAQPMAFPCFASLSGLSLCQHGQSISATHVQSGVKVTQGHYLVCPPALEPLAHRK